jgi:hypothetical protein
VRTFTLLLSGACLMASALAQPMPEQKKTKQPTAEQRMVLEVIRQCVQQTWRVPAETKLVRVRLRFRLQKSGDLSGPPEILNPVDTPEGKISSEAAIRAISACAPFKLPLQSYDTWKEIRLDFEPSPP